MALIEKTVNSVTQGGQQQSLDDVGQVGAVKLSRKGIPLVPQPTDDVFDPLNWSRTQKLVILAAICLWIFQGPHYIISCSSAFFLIADDLDCGLTVTSYLVSAPNLAYGVSSLFWVAIGNRFGVRFSFVFSSLASTLLCIWAAKADSFGSLIAARTLAGMFMASPETLAPQAIADVFFLRDRATCMALIGLFQSGGFSLGSLIGAYITADLGWRWTQWIQVVLCGTTCIVLLCLFPETQYTKSSEELHQTRERRLVDSFSFWSVSGGGKNKVDNFWRAFAYPFRYIPHPAVLLVTFHFGMLLLVTNYMLTSNSFIFQEEYAFDIKRTGLTALAPFLGAFLAIGYSGFFNDWYMNRQRNKSSFRPEKRFIFFVPTAILTPVGCILVGVLAANRGSYVGILVGEAFIMFSFAVSANVAQTYLVDVYLARADAALVIVNGFKPWASFGLSYALVPWNTACGYAIPFGILAVIAFFAYVPLAVFWWKGVQIRAWSARIWKDAQPTHHGDAF